MSDKCVQKLPCLGSPSTTGVECRGWHCTPAGAMDLVRTHFRRRTESAAKHLRTKKNLLPECGVTAVKPLKIDWRRA